MSEIDKAHTTKEGETEPVLGDIIPNRYLDKANAELKSGFREASILRNGELFIIRVFHPTVQDELNINNRYSSIFNKLMKTDGFMLNKEIENELRKRGVITTLDDAKMEQLQKSLKSIIENYNLIVSEGKTSKKKLDSLRKEYYELRDRLFDHNRKMNEHYVNSIESAAEQDSTFLKMCLCIKDVNNKSVWNSIDELYAEKDRALVSQCIQEGTMFWSNISREVLYSLPDVLDELHRGASLENSQEADGK